MHNIDSSNWLVSQIPSVTLIQTSRKWFKHRAIFCTCLTLIVLQSAQRLRQRQPSAVPCKMSAEWEAELTWSVYVSKDALRSKPVSSRWYVRGIFRTDILRTNPHQIFQSWNYIAWRAYQHVVVQWVRNRLLRWAKKMYGWKTYALYQRRLVIHGAT